MRNSVKIWKRCLYYNRFVRGITRVSNAELWCFLACYCEQAWTNNRVPGDFRCHNAHESPYPEPVVFQWQSSGNPVCLELRPQCTLECHWRNASVLPVVFQWSSSGFPVVFQCVPIMQINTGTPLKHHWVLASASVVPVASQCTCGSSGLPVCSNYAN